MTATTAPNNAIILIGHPNVGNSVRFHRLPGAYANVTNYPGMPQYVPGQDGAPQGMVPQGPIPQGAVPQGMAPVPMPNPAVEYVPNR